MLACSMRCLNLSYQVSRNCLNFNLFLFFQLNNPVQIWIQTHILILIFIPLFSRNPDFAVLKKFELSKLSCGSLLCFNSYWDTTYKKMCKTVYNHNQDRHGLDHRWQSQDCAIFRCYIFTEVTQCMGEIKSTSVLKQMGYIWTPQDRSCLWQCQAS
jgi:hypothetical protein